MSSSSSHYLTTSRGCYTHIAWRFGFDSLHFGEYYVHISAGDILAINYLAVLAKFGPVLPVQLLSCGFGVSVDCKLPKGRQEQLNVWTLGHDAKMTE